MNKLEEAIIYATVMHTGATRKNQKTPYILHPLEVSQIISTMTDDIEVITAGVLHDIVEDTDGSLKEIRARFGDRITELVASETENKYRSERSENTWERRKKESLSMLENADDIGIKILWLADKLSNIRSLAGMYSEQGEKIWEVFNQKDPQKHLWYYKSIAEILEIDLNRTRAFKEFVKHINFIWPGTFSADKTKYKKYREYSVEGCEIIGKGAKSTVYRYDDELVIKVYNKNNTYKDIERENYIAKSAFVAGIPTAISFGIVEVDGHYGSMFELLDSKSVSQLISLDTSRVTYYADLMADLAKSIHSTEGDNFNLPSYMDTVYSWVNNGIANVDEAAAQTITSMLDELPSVKTLIHGDFHTGNVMIQNGEPLIIDMDRLSVCHPIIELCGVYMFYIGFGELDHNFSESFLGFSYENQEIFYKEFLSHYLGTTDEAAIKEVSDKAALLNYVRLVNRVYKKGLNLDEKAVSQRDYYMRKIYQLLETVTGFDF